jgi:hypothetical protein
MINLTGIYQTQNLKSKTGDLGMKKLSIAIPHHHDFDGAYFTIQDIRKELIFNKRQDLLEQIEFVLVDNSSGSDHSKLLKEFASRDLAPIKFDIFNKQGSGAVKDRLIELADSEFVLVLDCHILLCPVVQTLEKILDFINDNPESDDLFYGPMIADNCQLQFDFFEKTWDNGMWGKWVSAFVCACKDFYFFVDKDRNYRSAVEQKVIRECQSCGMSLKQDEDIPLVGTGAKRLLNVDSDTPYEIWGQATGCFLTRKESWLGYNKFALGFGGEEGYIAEKYRSQDRKVYSLPFMKWMHRFQKVNGVHYPVDYITKLRNYILGLTEINYPLHEVRKHFVEENSLDEILFQSFVNEAKYLLKRE